MRIKSIGLQWFRGSAIEVTLESNLKSIVVYGTNGSGKSSFVDAVEYVIHEGRLDHLSHEYSGRRQEKGIINTQIPNNATSFTKFIFGDNKDLIVSIQPNGEYTLSGSAQNSMDKWEYMRTILRQNEVADFITGTKGEKYSALLPLLGLHHLEFTAENFRQLAFSVEKESKINETKYRITSIKTARKNMLGDIDDMGISLKIDGLCGKYLPKDYKKDDLSTKCTDILLAVDKQIDGLNNSNKTQASLIEVSNIPLEEDIKSVREVASQLIDEADPLIQERLAVLLTAEPFGVGLQDGLTVSCPACGQEVSSQSFKDHVINEKKRLEDIMNTFTLHKTSIGKLCDDVAIVKNNLDKDELKLWKINEENKAYADKFKSISDLDIEALRKSCLEKDIQELEANVLPIVQLANNMTAITPSDVRILIEEKEIIGIAKDMLEMQALSSKVNTITALIDLLHVLEAGARKEIRNNSSVIIKEISSDIQRMWEVLHPDKKIENIELYLPDDVDKAIDVHLKFYGAEQESPRLTLSEGQRNSLGLCIFLAMAKRDKNDRPLFLDDVIVSLDRGHRGMVADLLEKEFSDKQLFVFTHDREWFIELKQMLNIANWQFKVLRPWDNPSIGIRWSEKTMTFDDAREHLDTSPDIAESTARKIMDIELALKAEQLMIKLPYLHREKNDNRVAHEFLQRFITDGKKCFQIKEGNDYQIYDEAISAFSEADSLMVAWSNRATHTFDAVKNEAQKLIDACEKALGFFECSSCGKSVGRAEDKNSELKQCSCGNLRWQYGKA